MAENNANAAKPIKKKAGLTLIIAISLFAISLLATSVTGQLLKRHDGTKKDFSGNHALGVCRVQRYADPKDANARPHQIGSNDILAIKNLLSGEYKNTAQVIPIYRSNGQIYSDELKKSVVLYGIAAEHAFLLNEKLDRLADDTFYTAGTSKDSIEASIGVLGDEDKHGVTMTDLVKKEFSCVSVIAEDSPLLPDAELESETLLSCFVSMDTFLEVLEIEVNRDVSDLDKELESDSLLSPIISETIVYVSDNTLTDRVDTLLKSAGYLAQ
ncbi:MAG: hypothetical protein LBB67_01570 [Oscillospiraceae bacterium]|jgi:hypothetical protein|nr:hypothetical protein [Oscillospiraceae bacterium]